MAGARTYHDPCGIARSLDAVGERWALLVVRELLLGPKRFTDLRAGLRGVSPNVLSQRLRELEASGVVRRERLGPPTSALVYALTERGRELEPVLLALGRWGSRTPTDSTASAELQLGADSLVIGLKTLFDGEAAADLGARYLLRLGDERFRLEVAGGRFGAVRSEGVWVGAGPDATIETDSATLRSVVFGGRPLAEAEQTGRLRITGDRAAVARLVRLFPKGAGAPTG